MKKFAALLLTFLMIVSLTACGEKGNSSENVSSVKDSTVEDSGMSERNEGDTEAEDNMMEDTENHENRENNETKVLVAYFSATGTTKALAEYAADVLGADLFEIVPEEPYTDEDLNYNDNSSRSTAEQNDPNARPAISGSVENMEQYEIVFLGFPIWWGEEPRIMDTFVESYDFSGKTIVSFCTSGGSGFGASGSNLQALSTGEATWLPGERLGSSSSRDDIAEWINGLGLGITAE